MNVIGIIAETNSKLDSVMKSIQKNIRDIGAELKGERFSLFKIELQIYEE